MLIIPEYAFNTLVCTCCLLLLSLIQQSEFPTTDFGPKLKMYSVFCNLYLYFLPGVWICQALRVIKEYRAKNSYKSAS